MKPSTVVFCCFMAIVVFLSLPHVMSAVSIGVYVGIYHLAQKLAGNLK